MNLRKIIFAILVYMVFSFQGGSMVRGQFPDDHLNDVALEASISNDGLPMESSGNIAFWYSEAEDGIIMGSVEIREGCQYASGEKFVVLGNVSGNSLLFEHIEIAQTGTYQLRIDYFFVGQSRLEVIVNDISLGIFSFETANWCYQGAPKIKTIDIELVSGTNKVEFRATDGQGSPFMDKVYIMDPEAIQLSLTTTKDVVLPGEHLTLIIEAAQIPKEHVKVTFNVVGINEFDYRITPDTVIIPAGSNSASADFEALESGSLINYVFTVSIVSDNEHVVIDETGTVKLKVINQGTNYFVSSSDGDDTNDGRNREVPWKSIDKVNMTNLYPGDTVFFQRGDTFYGQLVVNGSGAKNSPLVFSSYGEGDKPVINGANVEGGAHLTSVLINNQEYIEMYHLEISNDRRQSRPGVSDNLAYGIYVLNDGEDIMRHFVFKHLTIRNVFAISLEGVDFNSIRVAGMSFRSEMNTSAGKEKNIRDVLVDSCYITRTSRYGIHTSHAGGAEGIGNDSINRNMNLVFRNNHFYHTGGSCITPGSSYNCLLENNIFDHPGSKIDPRMTGRGSAAWFWKCRNVIAQFNKTYHVRGHGDSYSIHVDWGNKDVIIQHNFSEDSEGGFAEILGDNINSTYRFNVSVNDGFRNNTGRSVWVSDYAGTNNRILSDSNFVYNNTIYVDANITPDIMVIGKNTFIYNNIFCAVKAARIGEQVTVDIDEGSVLKMSNNLFFGNVSGVFIGYDSQPVFGNPGFTNPGDSDVDGYRIGAAGSQAIDGGIMFPEPKFPMAGKGIFKDIPPYPLADLYGNPVSIGTIVPNIGAFNGKAGTGTRLQKYYEKHSISVYPNPVQNNINIDLAVGIHGTFDIYITDIQGNKVQTYSTNTTLGKSTVSFLIDANLRNGIYFLVVESDSFFDLKRFVLVR